MTPVRLRPADAAERDGLAAFVGRVVRLGPTGPVRLRARAGGLDVWAVTPFGPLVRHRGTATLDGRRDVTVVGSDLLAALSLDRTDAVDPGPAVDDRWRHPIPPDGLLPEPSLPDPSPKAGPGGREGPSLPAGTLAALVALAVADPHGPDLEARRPETTPHPTGPGLALPRRVLLAAAALDLDGPATVEDDGSWLWLGTSGGAVCTMRRTSLSLRPR